MLAKDGLAALLVKSLADKGFRRRRYNFYRLAPAVYSIVNLQSSSWGDDCYVNIGFSPADRVTRGWLPESKCMVRFRADSIRNLSPEDLRLLTDEVREAMGEQAWSGAVSARVVSPIVQMLDRSSSIPNLGEILRDEVANVFVHQELRPLLEPPQVISTDRS